MNFKNFKVIDAPFNTDHRLIKGKLISTLNHRGYRNYMKHRKDHRRDLFGTGNEQLPPTQSDILLHEIQKEMENNECSKPTSTSWISEDTFRLVRLKSRALRTNDSEEVNRLGKELRRSLRKDRRNRVWKVSVTIEEKLKANDIIGAFDILKHWYKKFTGKALKPSPIDLEDTRKIYENLFTFLFKALIFLFFRLRLI